jgi:TPR repeat
LVGEMGRFLVCLGAVAAVACGGSEARPVVARAPVAVAKSNATEARDHEHAGALLSDGDALVKVNVEAAIEKYGQALQLEPTNLDALWKLSLMYEKKGDWGRVAATGYVVKTNLAQAPRCAVHCSGIADVENCRAQIPAFWLGDRPDAPEADCLKVMGFASNYAQLYEAIRQADSQKPDEPYSDEYWGQTVPNPLPAAGAKLSVRGGYGLTFAKASSGAESDPVMGIMDFAESEVLGPAPELATLPGVKRRKR